MSARRNVDMAATKTDRPVTLTISARRGSFAPACRRLFGRSANHISDSSAGTGIRLRSLRAAVRATRLTFGGSRQAFLQFRLSADLIRWGLC